MSHPRQPRRHLRHRSSDPRRLRRIHRRPGHEFVGVVEQAPAADAAWVGKRVVGEINIGCRRCDWCARGIKEHCDNRSVVGIRQHDGAFAEYLSLPAVNLHAGSRRHGRRDGGVRGAGRGRVPHLRADGCRWPRAGGRRRRWPDGSAGGSGDADRRAGRHRVRAPRQQARDRPRARPQHRRVPMPTSGRRHASTSSSTSPAGPRACAAPWSSSSRAARS